MAPQVSSSEEEVHLWAEGAQAEGAESLHHPVHNQPHHGPEVLPHQNVPGGRLWVLLPVYAGTPDHRAAASRSFIHLFPHIPQWRGKALDIILVCFIGRISHLNSWYENHTTSFWLCIVSIETDYAMSNLAYPSLSLSPSLSLFLGVCTVLLGSEG